MIFVVNIPLKFRHPFRTSVLVVEILTSATEIVLALELNFERDKTGDEGKFHNTYINS